nr:unnamed protein product [Spirometra erinaceieuropaei]
MEVSPKALIDKDIKTSLMRLQIKPTNWDDLVQNGPTWRRAVIYEARRETDAKANVKPLSQTPRRRPPPSPPTTQSLPRRHQSLASSAVPHLLTRQQRPAPPMPRNHAHPPPMGRHTTSHNLLPSQPTPPPLAMRSRSIPVVIAIRTFISHLGLVGHLRIHHTETGKPVPGTPTYSRHNLLHRPHCPHTHSLGHVRIHENLRKTAANYISSSHLPPPVTAPHNANHSTTTLHIGGMCAARSLVDVTALQHV